VILFNAWIPEPMMTNVITLDQSGFENIITENVLDNGIRKRQKSNETTN
jgi:hypothetical protein